MALKGCCCCDLRGGSLAIGIFFLVMTVLGLLGTIPGWVVFATESSRRAGVRLSTSQGSVDVSVQDSAFGGSSGRVQVDTPFGSLDETVPLPSWSRGHSRTYSTYEYRSGYDPGLALCIMTTVTLTRLLDLLFNSLLIHGVNNGSACPMRAWLVYYGLQFSLVSLAGVGTLIAGLVIAISADSGVGLAMLFGGVGVVLVSALLWFWWAVVHTHRRQLTAGFVYHRELMMDEAVGPRREPPPAWHPTVPGVPAVPGVPGVPAAPVQ